MTTIDQKPFHRMIIGANKIKKKRTEVYKESEPFKAKNQESKTSFSSQNAFDTEAVIGCVL